MPVICFYHRVRFSVLSSGSKANCTFLEACGVRLLIDCGLSCRQTEQRLVELIRKHFDLSPRGIIETLDLRKPVYLKTASYGHFGRSGFTWEKTDKAKALKKDA